MRTYVMTLIAFALARPARAQVLPSAFDANLFALALCGVESEARCHQTELRLEQYEPGKYYYTESARSGGVEFWYKFIVYPSVDGRLRDGYYQQQAWGDQRGDGLQDIYLEFRSEHGVGDEGPAGAAARDAVTISRLGGSGSIPPSRRSRATPASSGWWRGSRREERGRRLLAPRSLTAKTAPSGHSSG